MDNTQITITYAGQPRAHLAFVEFMNIITPPIIIKSMIQMHDWDICFPVDKPLYIQQHRGQDPTSNF